MESGKNKFSNNLKVFVIVQGLNFFTMNLGNVFISLFLIHTSKNATSALIYNLFISIMILIAFFILSPICKRYDKKIGILIGNALSCVLYLLVILFGDNAGKYVLILGSLSGLAQGFFWLSTNTLVIDLTNLDNRKKYNSISGVMASVSGMIGPLVASSIIGAFSGLRGYIVLFSIILFIMIIAVILTCFLTSINGNSRFSFKDAYSNVEMDKFKFISKLTWKAMFRDGVLAFLLSILIFEVTKSEKVLSNLYVYTTIISIIVYYIVARNKLNINKMYLFGSALQLVLIILLTMFFNNIYVIILYMTISGIAGPMTGIAYGVIAQNKIYKIDKSGEYRFELNLIKEVWVGIGRITAIIILVLLYNINKDFSTLWIYGIMACITTLLAMKEVKDNRVR